jgi:hypothetical protein
MVLSKVEGLRVLSKAKGLVALIRNITEPADFVQKGDGKIRHKKNAESCRRTLPRMEGLSDS